MSFCKTSVSFKIARFQFCVIKSQKKIIHFFKGPTSRFSAAPVCSLLSLQVLLETLAGQRAVRMHGAQPKYLVSLLLRQVGREGGRNNPERGAPQEPARPLLTHR